MELGDQGLFPGSPALLAGAIGVGVGEEQQGVEEEAMLHEAGEFRHHIRIVDISFGGKSPQGEVMIDQKHDQLTSSVDDLQALADFVGKHLGAVDVLAHILSAPGVVKEDREVEGVGVFNVDEQLSVALLFRIIGGDQGVELIDAAQGMFVGGEAMEELVLDETFKGAKFRKVTAEHSAAMHESERATDLSLLLENGFEGSPIVCGVGEFVINPVPIGLDQLAQGRRGTEVVFLTVEKEAEQASGILGKDLVVLRIEASVLGAEAVEFLDLGFLPKGNPRRQAEGAENVGFDLSDFKDAGGVLVDVAGVKVVVPHERFNPAQLRFMWIIEGFSDDALKA